MNDPMLLEGWLPLMMTLATLLFSAAQLYALLAYAYFFTALEDEENLPVA